MWEIPAHSEPGQAWTDVSVCCKKTCWALAQASKQLSFMVFTSVPDSRFLPWVPALSSFANRLTIIVSKLNLFFLPTCLWSLFLETLSETWLLFTFNCLRLLLPVSCWRTFLHTGLIFPAFILLSPLMVLFVAAVTDSSTLFLMVFCGNLYFYH